MEEEKRQILWSEVLSRQEDVVVNRVTVETETSFHDHGFIEIIYIDRGQGWQKIGDEEIRRVGRGDLFVLNARVPHRLKSEPEKPLVVYNCLFNPETLDNSVGGGENFLSLAYRYLFHEGGDGVAAPHIRVHNSGDACVIMKEIYEECRRELPGSILMKRADLTRLLLTIFRAYDGEISPDTGEKPSLYGKMIANDTLGYLKIHYGENISCARLAERVFVSPDHFSRMFKRATGISPVCALQNVRMENAGRLLRETDGNVAEIARKVGYSDMKHFYRLFEAHYGTTPGRYRAGKGEI